MSRYRETITLTHPQVVALKRGKRCGLPLKRGQWVRLPDGRLARYVRHGKGGLWTATGNGAPYSINVEFAGLVRNARILEPKKSQMGLI